MYIEDYPAELKEILPVNSRWKIYLDLLEKCGGNYKHVFLTDTRDVIFQSDLFENFKNRSNYLCYATQDINFRGSKTDYDWFASRFGSAEADKILDKKVICAGTILGTVREIKIFCLKMQNLVKDNNFWGYDQVAMNYLIYNNLLPIDNFIESDIYSGEIFTASFASGILTLGDKISYEKNTPSVFHQYTLHENWVKHVDLIYRDKNFQVNAQFNDTRSIIEQTTSLLHANKIEEATRLFLKKYLTNPDLRKFDKALLKLFKTAANKPLTRTLELLLLALQDSIRNNVSAMSYNNLFIICDFLNHAKTTGITIEPDFKKYVVNFTYQASRQAFDSGNFDEFLKLTTLHKKISEFS